MLIVITICFFILIGRIVLGNGEIDLRMTEG